MRDSLRSFLVTLLMSSTPAFAQSEDVHLRFRATLYADMSSPLYSGHCYRLSLILVPEQVDACRVLDGGGRGCTA